MLPDDVRTRITAVYAADEKVPPALWRVTAADSADSPGGYSVSGAGVTPDPGAQVAAVASTPFNPLMFEISSSDAYRIARAYARASDAPTTCTVEYSLRMESPDSPPSWRLSWITRTGEKVGEVQLSAATGKVIAHPGFSTPSVARSSSSQRKQTSGRRSKNPFLHIGGELEEFFTGERTVDVED
jgi:hypothetical protein